MSAHPADALWMAVAVGTSAALFVGAVRRWLRARRAAEAAAATEAWAAANPHVVALLRDAGPLAALVVATYGDDVVRQWHAERGGRS